MSIQELSNKDAAHIASVANVDMKLEAMVIPVSDVDRAKKFYSDLGWRLDADLAAGTNFRLVQFTPPGSGCSIQFGVNLASGAPGTAKGLLLAVSDIDAAREELVGHGVEASEVFHCATGAACRFQGNGERVSGLHPEHLSYRSFVLFSDPDGNEWLVEMIVLDANILIRAVLGQRVANLWISIRSRELDSRPRNPISVLMPCEVVLHVGRRCTSSEFAADRRVPQPSDFVPGNPQFFGGINEGIDSNSVFKSFRISRNGCLEGRTLKY